MTATHWAVAALVLALLALLAGFLTWRRGTPWQPPESSPNGLYYVQKYATWSPRVFLPAGPGQGSDGVSGFLRLFTRDGRLLAERWAPFLRDVRPVWAGDRVFLLGIPELEDAPWILPGPAD